MTLWSHWISCLSPDFTPFWHYPVGKRCAVLKGNILYVCVIPVNFCSKRVHFSLQSESTLLLLQWCTENLFICSTPSTLAVESFFKTFFFTVILIFMIILCIRVILLCVQNNLLLCKFQNGKKLFFVARYDCRVVSWCAILLISVCDPEVLVVPVHQEYRARTKVPPHYWCNSCAFWRQIPSEGRNSPLKCGAFPFDGGSALSWGELE